MIAILLLAIVPMEDGIRRDRVDMVGINHVYDNFGNPTGEYVNFWRFVRGWPYDGWLTCQAWRRLDETGRPHRCPDGRWRLLWFDHDTLREVRAGAMWESWTQYDRELRDRDWFPVRFRKGLSP